MTTDASGSDPTPIEDGWEPEPDPRPWSERFGGGPVAYFQEAPARFFGWLGAIVFVGGWALAVYIAWFSDRADGGIAP